MKRFYKLCVILFILLSVPSFAQKHKTTTSSKYEIQGPYCNGLARVRQNHKWGFIDTTGSVIIPLKYNEVTNFMDGFARVRLGEKWGLMNTSGAEIIKPTFDWIYDFIDGVAKVKLNGEEYYMNTSGIRVPMPGSKPKE